MKEINHVIQFNVDTVVKLVSCIFFLCMSIFRLVAISRNKGTILNILYVLYQYCEPGSSVGITTNYGLDGPGSNPGGARDFPPVQTGPGAHPASCKMDTGSFPGVKCGRGVLLTTHLLVPRPWKSRAIHLPTLWATPGL